MVRSPTFPVREFAQHRILDSLLLSLTVDGSSTLLEIEISTLVSLIPQLAIHATDTLVRILPLCYTILARAVCWKPQPKSLDLLDEEAARSDSSSRRADSEIDAAQTPQVRSNMDWHKLGTDSTLPSNTWSKQSTQIRPQSQLLRIRLPHFPSSQLCTACTLATPLRFLGIQWFI